MVEERNGQMLPLGSIVYLKEGKQKIMILNRGSIVAQDGQDVIFDYMGGLYPLGFDVEHVYYFNAENIDKIIFEGFKDEEEERFLTLYEQWLAQHATLKKGDVKRASTNSSIQTS
jgi:hypothetical protein